MFMLSCLEHRQISEISLQYVLLRDDAYPSSLCFMTGSDESGLGFLNTTLFVWDCVSKYYSSNEYRFTHDAQGQMNACWI